MTDFLGTGEFEARLGGLPDNRAVHLSVGQLRDVDRKLARQASQIEFLEGEVYTKEGRWPRYLWTGWECSQCGFRTHSTTTVLADHCPRCLRGAAWTKVFWRRDDAVETAVAQQHVEICNKERTMNEHQLKLPRESVLAIGSLNSHITAKHAGAWGNCEHTNCSQTRYRLKYGAWPSTPRHLTEQVDSESLNA